MHVALKTMFGLLLVCTAVFPSQAKQLIHIKTSATSLVYVARADGRVVMEYYGNRLSDPSMFTDRRYPTYPKSERDYSYDAYPAFGSGYVNEPALSVVHSNGDINTELCYHSHETFEREGIQKTVVHLKDRISGLSVDLHIEAFEQEDVVTLHAVITNKGEGRALLSHFYSAFLQLKAESYHLSHFHGGWANEMELIETTLDKGIVSLESKRGTKTTQNDNSAFVLSLNGLSSETQGECIAGALAWSGNYKTVFQVDDWNRLNILSGMNPFMSMYHLCSGDSLVTPKSIFTYSSRGRGALSRNLHDWARNHVLYGSNEHRPVILNSWEGLKFDFNESTLHTLIDDAAKLGVEMFVLDDGWFGVDYPRNNDRTGLGDWQTNPKKLPNGLEALANYANGKGLMFGLWIEPEMVNPDSKLARKHPEWVVQAPNREKLTQRNQWILDLSNPEVVDFLFSTIDNLLTENPGISYLKWDANRSVDHPGSTYLPVDRQTHFWIEYTRGLYRLYERIRQKRPKIMIQNCSAGGGRLDFGSLAYQDEFWLSDNTDPLKRLYMQYGASLVYPPAAMGAHVSKSPNQQTGVASPIKFRFDVAMTGRLGVEMRPEDLSPEEYEFAVQAIELYKKEIRPLVMKGDLYRLVSPYSTTDWAAQSFVAKDKQKAVLFAYSAALHNQGEFLNVKLQGLESGRFYRIKEVNTFDKKFLLNKATVLNGEYLMNVGLDLHLVKQFDSCIVLLTTE